MVRLRRISKSIAVKFEQFKIWLALKKTQILVKVRSWRKTQD